MAEPLGVAEVRQALEEDRARDDITTALLGAPAEAPTRALIVSGQSSVVAGLDVAAEVYAQLDPGTRVTPVVADGAEVADGATLLEVEGPARAILGGERVALNFLQRLSGIATLTRRAVDAVRGTGAEITDTRKTTPGLRALEKYAVRVGGGINHRHSLADGILWKDNHWALAGQVGQTLADALARAPAGVPVIVEVESDAQLAAALTAGARHVLADNQRPDVIARWVLRCGPEVVVEASGEITPEHAAAYARAGARYIAIGALTHSAPISRMRLEIVPTSGARVGEHDQPGRAEHEVR